MSYLPNRKNIPEAHNRVTVSGKAIKVIKGSLNKLAVRPASSADQQESSHTVVGTVTGNVVVTGVPLGLFVVGETITGGTSLASALIIAIVGRELHFSTPIGIFLVGETLTGAISAATAIITAASRYNAVGQVFKASTDNINSLQLVLKTSPVSEIVDGIEQPTSLLLQSQWPTAGGLPATRDTGVFSTLGSYPSTASMKLDHTAPSTYTHLISHVHITATTGLFMLGETITGATSLATGIITGIDVAADFYQLSTVVGIFTANEVVTGALSAATGNTTTLQTFNDISGWESIAFDMAVSPKPVDQALTFSISDGINTASVIFTNATAAFAEKTMTLKDLAATGLPAAVDLTNVVSYSFTTSGQKFKGGYFVWVDNIRVEGFSGSTNVSLYDLGATLPVSGTTTLASGVPQTLFGTTTPTTAVTLALDAGTHMYRINGFEIGNRGSEPNNTSIVAGNYYAIVVSHVDTPVKVFGADPLAALDAYPNGFGFNASTLTGANSIITTPAPKTDLMFLIDSCVDSSILAVEVQADAPIKGASVVVVAEDNTSHVIKLIDTHPLGTGVATSLLESPLFLPAKAKLELYYSDSTLSAVTSVALSVTASKVGVDPYTGI